MKRFYHATIMENLGSIVEEGIKPGCDGLVYLCENAVDAAKFVYVRTLGTHDIVAIEIALDESEVEETFDHSFEFFKCRAFGYSGTIKTDRMTGGFQKFSWL